MWGTGAASPNPCVPSASSTATTTFASSCCSPSEITNGAESDVESSVTAIDSMVGIGTVELLVGNPKVASLSC
jgi:hypothetical protein